LQKGRFWWVLVLDLGSGVLEIRGWWCERRERVFFESNLWGTWLRFPHKGNRRRFNMVSFIGEIGEIPC